MAVAVAEARRGEIVMLYIDDAILILMLMNVLGIMNYKITIITTRQTLDLYPSSTWKIFLVTWP